jgi:preprotein translocase subunit SecB
MTQSTHEKVKKAISDDSSDQAHFSVHRIYLKALRFDIKNSPVPEGEKPKIETKIAVDTQAIKEKDHYYEGTLHLLVTCQQADQVIYEIDIMQAGVFELTGFKEKAIEKVISGYGMNLLYPYITQQIHVITQQAGFPPLLLPPMNFDTLYEQHQKQAMEEKAENEPIA